MTHLYIKFIAKLGIFIKRKLIFNIYIFNEIKFIFLKNQEIEKNIEVYLILIHFDKCYWQILNTIGIIFDSTLEIIKNISLKNLLHNVYLFFFKMYSLISAIKTVFSRNLISERKKFSKSLLIWTEFLFLENNWSNSWRNFFQFVLPLDRRKIWLLYWQCAFYLISTPFLFHSTKIFSLYI